jgi:hypothetical protein
MRLDGFAILKSIAEDVDLFSDTRDVVDKAALNILTAQLKAKTFDLDRLKRTCSAIGADTLALVLQHFPDAVPKTLIGRIDPHHAKARTDNANWMRSHIVALASGAAKPEPKPQVTETKTPSKGKKKPKSEEEILANSFWSSSVMATPQRSSKTTGNKTTGKSK